MIDLKSILGYSKSSPFSGNPYIDINSNIIDMSNTPMDLWGVDMKTGKRIKMKANRKNPYIFEGNVREIPIAQAGGHPPIYTNNPQDKRLQAYNDSLKLYDQMLERLPNNQPPKDYIINSEYSQRNIVNGIKPLGYTYSGGSPVYKKPVQPVVYQKPQQAPIKQGKPTRADSSVAYNSMKFPKGFANKQLIKWAGADLPENAINGVSPIGMYVGSVPNDGQYPYNGSAMVPAFKKPSEVPRPQQEPQEPQQPVFKPVTHDPRAAQDFSTGQPNVQAPNMQRAEYDFNKKTPYSYTYPTGPYNQQESMYFPDERMLRSFAGDQVTTSMQASPSGATATGYLKEKKRGGNPYMAQGGNINQILWDLFNDDEDDNPHTAPTTEEVVQDVEEQQAPRVNIDENDILAMQIAMEEWTERRNPYKARNTPISRGVNPYANKTEKDIFSTFPQATNLGIWGDKAHQARKSDHNTGDAQDFGVSDMALGNQIAAKLQKEAANRKVKYIIFNRKIWNPSISNEWRTYTGTNPHTDHVHVSYNR